MKIHLPNSAFLGNIDSFLKNFDASNPKKLRITANKAWISVHPAVLAMVAALGLKVESKSVECEQLEAKSRHYFERMRLFNFLGVKSGITVTEHEAAGRFIPLTKITNSRELSEFIANVVPILHLKPKEVDPIKYVVSELVRNALEHSGSKQGAIVCAQYYKKSNTIRIGIADTGVGIKKTINIAHAAKTDLDAIQLALTPGITGMTKREGGTEFNAGAGLFFIKSLAKVNGNFFMIYSGNAMYKLLKSKTTKTRLYGDPFKDRHSKGSDYPYWQGTIVGIDLSLDTKKEFSAFLELVRDAYFKTIQERKKQRCKKAKFI